MQDVESHTTIYLRELRATRAVDKPDVATFLACWLYEETFHELAWRDSQKRPAIQSANGPVPSEISGRRSAPLDQRDLAVCDAAERSNARISPDD